MKTTRLLKIALASAAAATLASCYYDSYGSGYSESYGYSGGGVSFVHTSSDRWFYDPQVRCYYDRSRHLYYDPFLYSYYPSGYCPRPVYNYPHPYGWNGRGTCPVPTNIGHGTIGRDQDRLALLRNRNYSWAHDAGVKEVSSPDAWRQNRIQAASNYRVTTATQNRPSAGIGNHQAPVQNQHAPQGDRGSFQRPESPAAPARSGWSGTPNREHSVQQERPASRPDFNQGGSRPGYNQPIVSPVSPQPQASRPERAPAPAYNPRSQPGNSHDREEKPRGR